MNGKCIYFAIAALCAVLSVLVHFFSFFVLSLIYVYLLFKYKRFSKPQLSAIVGIMILFALITCRAEMKNSTALPEDQTTFHLEYIQDPKIDGNLLQIFAKETKYNENLLIRYQIHSEKEKQDLGNTSFYNKLCLVSGTMGKPKISKNPNGFNYRSYLAAKQVYWLVDTKQNLLQSCSTLKSTPITLMKQLRFSGVHYLENHFPPEIASLSAALIFGDRSMINPELLDEYQKTGIVHLLAISGLHVSLFIGMVFYLGIRIGLTRQTTEYFLIFILPVYVILTGASPSVIRACLMMFLVLIAVKWGKKIKLQAIDAISLALMIYLIWSPFIIYDIGFQLSFSVSFAIILSSRQILNTFALGKLTPLLATSVISQLAAFPFLLYHYFQLSLIGFIANIIFIPLFSFIYLPGLYVLFLIQIFVGFTPSIFILIFSEIINISNQLMEIFSRCSFANFNPGRPNLPFLIIYILLIISIFYLWETKYSYKWKEHLLLSCLLLFTLQPLWNWLNPYGEVTMIDVGQGDSIYIHLPFNQGDYLIDTGGTMIFSDKKWMQKEKPFEVGRDVVVPFLKAKGVTKIDKLILSHGDMDHVGGSIALMKELKVRQILLPSVAEESETEQKIINTAKLKGIPVIKGSKGMYWGVGQNSFFILSPETNFKGERNRGSLTILAKIGGLSWFFGGDLDKTGEEKIIKKFPNLTVDVLKAGHHGSKTSSSPLFIHKIKPKVTLISAGENNRFGHPHPEVLQLLQGVNTRIYRTDQQGAITYRFFKSSGTFLPYLQ
ncbi:DNA internalization-related competence protein ComEC/Rec2 [Bacillus sp. BRMEA1]|uniref:DNA internalization-related competence protein ComEC/Rec2 n=1 Tax=Neobacillus endophyticus TaxID=2738405 RepID=UPI001567533F|nr:DNA internalization-related competence protein ComEC/Rec2 [Neobacillus endophyticus]NRD75900.1 DNA internalization-related competence protein ComEC/Rec2 [Neobacillus endophyticus]